MTRAAARAILTIVALAAAPYGCGGDDAGAEATGLRPVPADVVVSWNDRILGIAEAEDGFLTLKGVRTASMMHAAMHDALAAIDPRYHPFQETGVLAEADGVADGHSVPDAGADPVAAANIAAYEVAISQYPDQETALAAERSRWLAPDLSAHSRDAALRLGERSAEMILRSRDGDGWNREPGYQWHPMGPGVYAEFNEHSGTPRGFVFGSGWAGAQPFLLERPSQFRSPPPPDILSDAYARAFNEVKEVGRRGSTTRTADQSHLAMWWKEFVEKSHNRLARELVADTGLDLWDAARLFALLNMSVFDGYVASFDGKFFYNHWRPYTAIRWASNDGNPDTEEDAAWTNLHDHTYAFPSYPSAHGTVCAAAMTVIGSVFGDDVPFEMTIREAESAGPMSPKVPLDPVTRSFGSFSQAAEECSMSRVYLGIHFRYDSEAGTELGRRVGELAIEEHLARR